MKFRRQAIEKALTDRGEEIDTEFILKGTFDDGSAPLSQPYNFEGRDSITKIVQEESPSGSSGKGNKKK